MKGTKSNRCITSLHCIVKTLPHLDGCCFGKRDDQDFRWADPLLFDQVFCSLGDNGGFSGARPCKTDAGTCSMGDCPGLSFTQTIDYFYNFSIAAWMRLMDSSFPRISRISVAPAGVVCLPERAVWIGHMIYPVLYPCSLTNATSASNSASLL